MNITQLEAKRRAAQRQLDQALAPQRQVDLATQELADLDEQIAAAQRLEQDERQRTIQRQMDISEARARIDNRWDLRIPAYEIYRARLRLIDLGEPDPGDLLISVEEIAKPMYEARQRTANELREALARQLMVADDQVLPEQERVRNDN